MGKQYPLGCPLRKNNVLERVKILIYALPLGLFGITVGRITNRFGVMITP